LFFCECEVHEDIVTDLHRSAQICLCTHVDTIRHHGGTAATATNTAVPALGIRELRAGLSDAVRRAAAGQRTVVTTGGRPVAQLGPLDADAPALDRLIGAGAVIPPRRSSQWRAPDAVPVWAGSRVDQVLRELRG
jgi:antitoxin (DNA-binding transcriptional repressor) of toxin-antitoxin stability system